MRKLLSPLALIAAAGLAFAVFATSSAASSSWSISGVCNADGTVSGTIHFPAGTAPFTVSVQDHVPGDGHFKDVAGSGGLVTPGPTDTSASFGPLDTENVRPNFNSLRVVNSASNEKSPSFFCAGAPSPTQTPD